MRTRIHRGANEIGGSCIEVESHGERLVLDLGRPLWAGRDEEVPLPPVMGLTRHDPSLRAVVISHPHPDHYGLACGITAPIVMGEAAHRLLAAASFFTGATVPPRPVASLRDREPLELGPFTVTPFLVDHSAYDAYSLLVEADGRRLFYTGDFRAHGRKRGLFERLLREPPAVDVLLAEGTNLRGPDGGDRRGPSEAEVEDGLAHLARWTPGMLLAAFSPQNVDRLVTVFRAALRSDRDLVLDLYAATVAAATGRATIPQAGWDRVRVYLPRSQRRRILATREFERTAAVRASRIYPEELAARAGELVVAFRGGMEVELASAGALEGAHLAWSMWPGYLEDADRRGLDACLARHGVARSVHHASGHAYVPDLLRLVDALAPARVVPIHTIAGDDFGAHLPGVDRRADGEWWSV